MGHSDSFGNAAATRWRFLRFAGAFAAVVVLLATGCGPAPSKPPVADVVAPDTVVVDVPVVDATDVWQLDLPETLAECPGAAGCVCQTDGDCNSGLCTEAPDGKRCGVLCGAGCSTGTVCRTANTAGEPINYCAPVGVRQCAPCLTSADCNAPWSAPAVCASAGATGSFCASTCTADGDCPAGLKCQQVEASGGKQLACAPASGIASCNCSPWAIAKGSSTACDVAVGTDLCPGTRSCGTAGLSECKATPGAVCVDTGCKEANNGDYCNDGDPCFANKTCQDGQCQGGLQTCACLQTSDCTALENGDLCDGTLYCDLQSHTCKVNPVTVVQCLPSGNPCEVTTCLPLSGQCANVAKPDATVCEDGAACTIGDYCQAGQCVSGTVTCDCQADLDCAAYEDGNACNGKLFCNKAVGKCQLNPKTIVQCPSGLNTECQVNSCDPATGACGLSPQPNTTLCEDGNPCSGSDHCDGLGGCISSVDICPCDNDAACVAKEDGNLCNGTLYCELTSKTCQLNPATVVHCPWAGDNPCAPVLCQPQTGECQPTVMTKGSCDDGDPCTALGLCKNGSCVAGANVCQCETAADCGPFDDANPCNGTYYCDVQSGQCLVNPASIPTCSSSLGDCVLYACSPTSGQCEAVQAGDGDWCNDSEPCTKSDTCFGGTCKGGTLVCACLVDSDCLGQEDGNLCNGTLICDRTEAVPQCVVNPLTVVTCTDGNDCTDPVCLPANGTCVTEPVEGTCADGNVCTVDDVCFDGACLPGDVTVCDDQNVCTDDSCSAASGCVFLANAVTCSDGDACTGQAVCVDASCQPGLAKSCDDGNLCTDDSCDVAIGCVFVASLASCTDDNACTTGDQCGAGACIGTTINCDDGYVLSTDSCVPTSGCKYLWPETCDGIDNDEDGTTDNVVCGSGACTCGAGGVATCPADCTVCPDDGDLAIPIDDGGTAKVTCAHDYPAWGVAAEAPATFVDNGDGTISDGLTGLQWQKVVDANTYTLAGARTYCDGLSLATKKDWRVPTQFEVETLVDFAKTAAPTIAAQFIAATPSSYLWSTTPYHGGSSIGWGVYFNFGGSDFNGVTGSHRVRCVRQEQTSTTLSVTANGRYVVDASAQTVEDKLTGLTWQREPPTSGGDGTGRFDWAAASIWCADLVLAGQTDWRLPGVVELQTLVRRKATGAAIDTVAFPNTPVGGSSYYWSETSFQGGAAVGWGVNFNDGRSNNINGTESLHLRCVRSPTCGDGQCEPGEAQDCALDCGCSEAKDSVACDDGNPCTTADQCGAGTCIGTATDCDDGYALSTDGCDPSSGCKYLWPEACDGIDNDEDGTTDNVVCGSGACTCGAGGVATCPADCTVCPDDGDLAIPIDDGGTAKVVCAHDYPAWGLAAEAPDTFTDNSDGTISDSLTGLQWQKVVDANTYQWTPAKTYCDGLSLAAKKDWRLPTQFELESLVDFAKTSAPPISAVFSGTPSAFYFSATPNLGGSSSAWSVSFIKGRSSSENVTNNYSVRCVRNEQTSSAKPPVAANGRYGVDVTAKTVLDKVTGLTWQREPPTTGGDGTGRFALSAAKTWCADLVLAGQSDWRLPGIVELRTLVLRKTTGTTIDTVAFPNTPVSGSPYYWSATPYQGGSSSSWFVVFNNGGISETTVASSNRVRCVRSPTCGDGQCEPGETQACALDCGCSEANDSVACDDGNPCTTADQCGVGTCIGTATDCDDGYALSTDGCDPTSGCKYLWPETCDGLDNDADGTTDNVVCGSGACTCGAGGVATCPADCTVCPDEGDLEIPIDDGGTAKVVCAHDYPAWGLAAESPDTFTDNSDGTISDSLTGLQWQKVVDANTYTWAGAKTYCDGLSLASKQDWRMPTQFELESLVDFAKTSAPAIAAQFVAGTPGEYFWSATPYQGGSSVAWGVYFGLGYSYDYGVTSNLRVRCVRDEKASNASSVMANDRYLVDATAKSVLDKVAGLTWQREPPVTGGSSGQTTGRFNWADAKQYCDNLVLAGQSDWRLPKIVELRTLVRRKTTGTAIDAVAFPNTPVSGASWYWSATPYQGGSSGAWIVFFVSGVSDDNPVTNNNRVRCVR